MLESAWEAYATSLANASSDQEIEAVYTDLVKSLNIDTSLKANVIYGRDSRCVFYLIFFPYCFLFLN